MAASLRGITIRVVAALTAVLAPAPPAQVTPLPRAHAHNDYEHDQPLLDALAHGFMSVEADVHLVGDELLVAHDRDRCVPGRTLRALYLEPLAERVRRNGGRVYAGGPSELQLLIDFKTGGEATWRAVARELAAYAPMLSRFRSGAPREPRAVLAVLSGAAPAELVLAEPDRLCGLDRWFDDAERSGDANACPLISARWGSQFQWHGAGAFPAAERAKLVALCARAHAAGRRIRFWAVPDRPVVWRELLAAGVDWLNVDDLAAARDFLLGDGRDLWSRAAIDRLLDDRFGEPADCDRLAARFAADGRSIDDVERLVRTPRVTVTPPRELPNGELIGWLPLRCDHVDYETTFLLYLPKGHDPTRPSPLLVVGHGGNGAMQLERARQAALGGTAPWREVADAHGIILAAPITQRGWGAIGNSVVVSLISQLQRWFHVDPDRVYLTGHSMGGHLSWRTALTMSDRFGAIAPMSGGYDYVARGELPRLFDVPGYATFGRVEPYGIADFNRRMRGWLAAHGYDHWRIVEKDGGHEIFADELPAVAAFLLAHPRDPYPPAVYAAAGATPSWATADRNERWGVEHTWIDGRPIPQSIAHWLELAPNPALPPGELQQALARVDRGANRIDVTSRGVRGFRLHLHPRLVDFGRPLRVVANGETVFAGRVEPDLAALLRRIRAFDDRGRGCHATVECAVWTDAAVPVPMRDPPQ
ncbi:MAG: hypothetical protein IPM29_07580 [Planctomycetes bacterium]|nr:hypothetical protein [Planctomycetota bacterium]